MLKKDQAQEYISRWAEVGKVQREELRALTPRQKLEQLADLMSWAETLALRESLEAEDEQVWQRWNLLRNRIASA